MLVKRGGIPVTQSNIAEVRELRVQFKTNYNIGTAGMTTTKVVKAVDGVSFGIPRGEILSVVGESGSGKTTLGRSMVGLTKPSSGAVMINGAEVNFHNRKSLRKLWRTAQMIFQDPYSTFNPLWTIHQNLEVPIRKFKLAKTEVEATKLIESALSDVDIEYGQVGNKFPNQLSGGQRQRAAIARALVVRPDIIIADEPVSMLDVSLRAGILKLLKKLNETEKLTVMFITHDLAVAQYLSDSIAVMYRGKIVEMGGSDDVIQSPMHPYTELLLKSAPKLKEASWSGKQDVVFRQVDPLTFHGCKYFPICPIGADQCTGMEPELVEVAPGHLVSCYLRGSQ